MMYFAISHDTFPCDVSNDGNMRRHPNKGAMSVSVPMPCNISTLVTELLPSSFNNLIFIYHFMFRLLFYKSN